MTVDKNVSASLRLGAERKRSLIVLRVFDPTSWSFAAMAAKSPLSPTIMEVPEEPAYDDVSPLGGVDKQLGDLSLQDKQPSHRKRPSLPAANLSINPTPHVNVQTPVFTPPPLASPLGPPNFERSYLLENLQRQHDRGERLSYALSNVQVKLASAQSKGEARKLRKEVGLLRSKIAESRKQVQLIMLRLNDLQSEELGRRGMLPGQATQAAMFQYPTYWTPYPSLQPWSPFNVPLMSPLSPVSPVTPLPSGLYHPTPMIPSPLDSPNWFQSKYPLVGPAMPFSPGYDQTFMYSNEYQQPYAQEQSDPTPTHRASFSQQTKSSTGRHKFTKSVDFSPAKDGSGDGRRWSLADTFSPTPRDKRMSMPGLQTIWKDKEQPEE